MSPVSAYGNSFRFQSFGYEPFLELYSHTFCSFLEEIFPPPKFDSIKFLYTTDFSIPTGQKVWIRFLTAALAGVLAVYRTSLNRDNSLSLRLIIYAF